MLCAICMRHIGSKRQPEMASVASTEAAHISISSCGCKWRSKQSKQDKNGEGEPILCTRCTTGVNGWLDGQPNVHVTQLHEIKIAPEITINCQTSYSFIFIMPLQDGLWQYLLTHSAMPVTKLTACVTATLLTHHTESSCFNM